MPPGYISGKVLRRSTMRNRYSGKDGYLLQVPLQMA